MYRYVCIYMYVNVRKLLFIFNIVYSRSVGGIAYDNLDNQGGRNAQKRHSCIHLHAHIQ